MNKRIGKFLHFLTRNELVPVLTWRCVLRHHAKKNGKLTACPAQSGVCLYSCVFHALHLQHTYQLQNSG